MASAAISAKEEAQTTQAQLNDNRIYSGLFAAQADLCAGQVARWIASAVNVA